MTMKDIEANVGHAIALILVIGFFAIAFITLLGMVDLKDATVATYAGTALGYAGAKVEVALRRYFGKGEPPDLSDKKGP